jgi:membrane fusion protein (multidrug efflux system)
MDITAEVIASEPVLDKNRTVRFRSIVHNVPLAVRPGAFVDVEAPLMEAQKALFVPLTAVRQAPQGAHVFVIEDDADGKPRAKQRFVKLGMVKGSDVMITSGLKAGERIAADGSFKLFEGVLVRIKEAGL